MADNAQSSQAATTSAAAQQTDQSEPQTVSREDYDKLLAESRKWEKRAKENSEAAKRLAEYERKAERASIVAEVAAAKGVDAEWLGRMAGDGREAIEANADYIANKLSDAPIYPSVPDNGGGKGASITREQIDAIKDRKERLRLRAQHLNLYK